jgi:hypothetical protein
MGFVGLLLQLSIAGLVGYMGYTFQLNFAVLLICPLGLIIGQLMRTRSRSSGRRERGMNAISAFIAGYLTGLVAVAIFFGVGYGLMHILDLRPAEGVGRYQ